MIDKSSLDKENKHQSFDQTDSLNQQAIWFHHFLEKRNGEVCSTATTRPSDCFMCLCLGRMSQT